MIRLRLRVITSGNFRKNEATLYTEFEKEHGPLALKGDDCILFVSKTGKILRFVFAPVMGKKTSVLSSQTLRITVGGTWNPLMLKNYAAQLGIELAGLKCFEDYYQNLV